MGNDTNINNLFVIPLLVVSTPADLCPVKDLATSVPEGIPAEPAVVGILARLGAAATVPVPACPKDKVIRQVATS